MKTFKISKKIWIDCESEKTRYGFRHLATLYCLGQYPVKAKCCYYNRTWESFEFESVIGGVFEKATFLTEYQKKDYLNKIKAKDKRQMDSQFKMVANIAKLGEILGSNQKEKNDWKERMLKAGLENKGLIMPEDWNELNEDIKEARLNGVIEELKKVGK